MALVLAENRTELWVKYETKVKVDQPVDKSLVSTKKLNSELNCKVNLVHH